MVMITTRTYVCIILKLLPSSNNGTATVNIAANDNTINGDYNNNTNTDILIIIITIISSR